MNTDTPVQADNLFTAAKSYAMGVRSMVRDFPEHPGLHLPLYFMSAFAFELSFKAALASCGAKQAELRACGHDLRKLLKKAQGLGYRAPDGHPIEAVVNALADGHKQLWFRYVPDTEYLHGPRVDRMCLALAKHIDEVEKQFDVWSNTPLRS